MKASEFLTKIKESNLLASDVIKKIFEGGYVDKKEFEHLYDSKGTLKIQFSDKEIYNTFCPFHSGQTNGDSFAIYNENKEFFCYNGNCSYSQRPINLIEFVMATVLDLDHSIVFEFDLAKSYFWRAARFLVTHFGDEIGVSMSDVKTHSFKNKDVQSEILKATADYYHFLATKNELYNNKIKEFLIETRYLDNGVVPVDELIKDNMIGITPFSKEKNKLYNFLVKKNYSKEDILKSKVCVERNGKVYDFFNQRAIVPYINKGKVIGMYGRDLQKNGNKKFRHMRLESEVKVPNGLDKIIKEEEFFLVEGEFSKIAVNALGFSNVMETRGVNGFKESHAEIIKKVRDRNSDKCKKCYIAFDPDDAGANSVKKIGKRLIDAGVEVLVLRLPIFYEKDGDAIHIDPNDILEMYGRDSKKEFEQMKDKSISYDTFILIHELSKNRPKTLSEARMSFRNLSHYLEGVPKLERIFIIEEFLEKLETAIDKDLLRDYLKETWLSI